MKMTRESIATKNAHLKLSLRAKSGFRSTMDCEVSPLQWAAINAICNETDDAAAFMAAMSDRLLAA